MAHYTFLNGSEVKTVGGHYPIGDVVGFELLHGGSENTNYKLRTAKDKYVLTICEQKTKEEAYVLANLLEHLAKYDFKTTTIVRTINGEPFILWNGKPVMIKTWIDGKVLDRLSPALLELVGAELGKLHNIPPPSYLPKQLSYGMEQFEKVQIYAPDSTFFHWLQQVRDYVKPYFDLDLPRVLIHSDVFTDNVIVSAGDDSVTIFDFEEAADYYRVFDIGMTIIGTCDEGTTVNMDHARHLVKAYQAENPLSETEWRALKAFTVYAGAAMTFWRHQNFNYSNPDPRLSDHYLGLKSLTDFVWQKPENCFL